jgi:DHA1 family tetracycline resistance protein-like MFS transporter
MKQYLQSYKFPILLFTIFIDLLGIGILIPVIPQLLANPASSQYLFSPSLPLSTAYIIYGFLAAAYPLALFLAAPILGQLSDRFGRKPILVISLLGTCVGYFVFAFAIITKNIPLLFLSRIFDGLTGGNISVAQAAIADITQPENRAKSFGLVGAIFGIGFILGPYIGGILSDPAVVSWFSAATPFWFTAILSFCNALFVFFFLPETHLVKNPSLAISWNKAFRHIARAVTLPSHIWFLC